ncbi:MAG: hypothetical protein HQL52_11690 [Magnetococcales bacterium]|nr:hypothetical protein [Magnetococcales bacterium]
MLFKILIPAIVIAAVYFLGRNHAHDPKRLQVLPPVVTSDPESGSLEKSRAFQLAAFGSAAAVVLVTAWLVYDGWREERQVVIIRVVNTQTGIAASYRSRQGDVHLRTFLTLDGRRVTLADVERMEVAPAPTP